MVKVAVVLASLLLGQGPAAQAGDGVLTLADALARARSNARIAGARAAAQAAAARLGQARAAWLPSATTTVDLARGTVNGAPRPGRELPEGLPAPSLRANPDLTFYGAALDVSQKIWDFGQTSGLVRAASEEERAARSAVAATGADVALEVRAAYYGALAAVELQRIAEQRVASAEKHRNAVRDLVRFGKRPGFDLTTAQIELANARVSRLEAGHAVVESRLALAAAMGVDDLGSLAMQTPPPSATRDPAAADVRDRALAHRPELAALDARLRAQTAVLGAQQAGFFPSLSATGQVSWLGAQQPGLGGVANWMAGLQLAWPLLAGGGDLARLGEEKALLQGLQAERQALVLQIRLEVQRLVNAVAAARARQQAADSIVGQARENLEVAEQRYGAGVATIVELSDAQATLTAAEAQHARAGYDLELARARLHRAAGEVD